MRVSELHRQAGFLLAVIIWLLAVPLSNRSAQLPIKIYTTADGLARDQINRIVKDSRGYLWFCTPEGLSRFDGYKFTNYTLDQGLPDRHVNDLRETRDGVYWIATSDGVCRFNPTGSPKTPTSGATPAPMFAVYRPDADPMGRDIAALAEDRTGAIWCGATRGLYRLVEVHGAMALERVNLPPVSPGKEENAIEALLVDRHGTLWIGTDFGLCRRAEDGRLCWYTTAQGLPSDFVQAFLEDSAGRLWAGTRYGGLCQIIADADLSKPITVNAYTEAEGLLSDWINAVFEASDKRLWIGTNRGLTEMIPTAEPYTWRFQNYTTAQGLSDAGVGALAEDRDGSLWLGTENGGALRLVRNGFRTYGVADGLGESFISSIFENQAGALCVVTADKFGKRLLNRFDGERFLAVQPKLPAQRQHIDWGWGSNQIALQDRQGEWWLATGEGLYRYPKAARVADLAHVRPKAIYTPRDGLGSPLVFRLYEDSRGDIWIGTWGTPAVTRWERATATFHQYSEADSMRQDVPTAFGEDAAGNVWIGFYGGGLVRYQAGQFTRLMPADGVPAGMIRALYLDQRGRLWIGSSQEGLGRIDDPAADRPSFTKYMMSDGLSSNDVWSITNDQWGRIYAGTGRGLDRLDPQTAQVVHYTSADGLAQGKVEEACRDRHGALWFGTSHGLSRLIPEPDHPGAPPPIVISGLRIAGVTHRVSELGETEVSRLVLEPGQNDVQIDFAGLSFSADKALRYQYKLEGADADWSALTEQRTVNYANLQPGNYRFVVQAVSADGSLSPVPATVTFTIRHPVWQRWWFLTLAALAVLLASYVGHRYRLARLVELERIRTRIATDLHDDIGSSLSRMAILSEVVKRQVSVKAQGSVSILTEIADSARSLVDTMSDIVWSIDPRRDDLSDLALRIREFASDVLEARGIDWELQIPQEFDEVKLNPDQRRQLFLIFKEALNNIARHAGCRAVWLNVDIAHHQLTAEVQDDGCGFMLSKPKPPATNGNGGHGLENMQRRATQIGGHLSLHSSPGKGTCLKLIVPLKKT